MCNIIYCITSKRDYKKYIGKTNNLPVRIKQHKRVEVGKHYNPHFQNYYNKYFKGVPFEEAFTVSVIHDNISDDDVNRLEKETISFYNTRNEKRGFNLRFGGEGGKLSFETRLRMKEVQRSRSKAKVYVYTVDGVFIGYFNSLVSVAEKLQLNYNAVNNAYQRSIRYKNFVFLKEPASESYKYIPNRSSCLVDIYVYDNQKRFIEKVHGMRECAKKYSINPNTINTSCNRGGLVFGKYYFSRTEITEPKENQHGL